MRPPAPQAFPLVSVVVPLRNEASFIQELVSSIFAQDYPSDRLEVIVADGMSTDGTRELLQSMQAADDRLVLLDNPGRIVSTGLNAAVQRARGEVIIRVDGHALVAPDFIRQNVRLLEERPDAWSVGGPIRHAATTTFGKAIAVAMSHPLGVGNALHRYPDYEGYVEGAQFPAFRRWVFDRIGTFDERLVRNQDDEFNYRIHLAGGRVYVSPLVRYTYFVRSTVSQLFRQYFQYGYWRIPVIEKHRRPTTWRQIAPTLFLAACVALALTGIVLRRPLVATAVPIAYGIALATCAVSVLRRERPAVAVRVPLAIATMHVAYGLGVAYGLWSRILRGSATDTAEHMTALSR